jgi:hypothetical protein
MQIKTKYDIGQKVYFITGFYHFSSVSRRCPNCLGLYKKKINGGEWRCAKCEKGKIKSEKESLSIEIDKEPFTVSGIVISIDDKGLIKGERVIIKHKENGKTYYSHFIANFDDKRNDDWVYAEKDMGVEKGIKFRKVFLNKRSALIELDRVKEILTQKKC